MACAPAGREAFAAYYRDGLRRILRAAMREVVELAGEAGSELMGSEAGGKTSGEEGEATGEEEEDEAEESDDMLDLYSGFYLKKDEAQIRGTGKK